MSFDLAGTLPPDDTGTDTVRRYRYQAHIAFPYCLSCVTGGNVLSVIMEHFEDLVIEYQDHWLFVQIKTRDPSLGPWKLTHALGEKGGLRSLARTFRATRGCRAGFSLFLEGAVATGDPLQFLIPPRNPSDSDLQRRAKEALQFTAEECEAFLQSTAVQPSQPHRDTISNRNVALLGHHAPHVPHGELVTVQRRVIDEILAAMAREPLGELLPAYINDPSSAEETTVSRLEAKRLARSRLLEVFGSVADGPYPLLQRLTSPNSTQPSDLEMKMLAAGASGDIIADAKRLRANAASREAAVLAAELYDPDARVEDVHERLIVLNNSIVQTHQTDEKPAIGAWRDLLSTLMSDPASIDPNRVYRQDPFLLLGATCALADRCLTNWGIPIA